MNGWLVVAALVLAGLAGATGWEFGSRHATTAASLKMETHLKKDTAATLEATEKARKLETKLAETQEEIASAYEKGKIDAETTAARVAADLRTGSLRLRAGWAGCETMRLSETAASTRELDAATRDREESAGRIVRAASQCDAQVLGLQELLRAERTDKPR